MQRSSGILSGAVPLMIISSAASTAIVLLVLLSLIDFRPLIINYCHNESGFGECRRSERDDHDDDPQAQQLMNEIKGENIVRVRDGIEYRLTEDTACVHCFFLRRLIHAKLFQGSDASNVNAGRFVVKQSGPDMIKQAVDDPHVKPMASGGDRVHDDAMANHNNSRNIWRSRRRNRIGYNYYEDRSARKLLSMLNSTSPSMSKTSEHGSGVIDIHVDNLRNRSRSSTVDQDVGRFDTVDYSRPNTHPPKNN